MKKISKFIESNDNKKFFKVLSEVDMVFKADNEGEVGYLADHELGTLPNQTDFRILDISEITKEEYDDLDIITESRDKIDFISKEWDMVFGKRKVSITEKMEFYHNMRKFGFEGIQILNTLGEKISFYKK